jgi:TolA-binding protein
MKKIANFCFIFLLAGCATSDDIQIINKRLIELESRINNQKLMELLQAVENTKQQFTVIRGDIELIQHDLAHIKKRQDDLYNDLDNRITEQKKMQDTVASRSNQFSDLYRQTMDLMSQRQFEKALLILNQMIQLQHQPDYIPDTGFWMGIAYTGLGQFDKAIEFYGAFQEKYPNHPRAAEALYNMASCYQKLNKESQKTKTLQTLLKRYPNSEVAKKYQTTTITK